MAIRYYPFIATEGWVLLAVVAVLAAASFIFVSWMLGLLLLAAWALLLYLFRDPPRAIPASPLAIVAPASGTVVQVRTLTDNWSRAEVVRIDIRVAWRDVYALRAPTEGKIVDQRLLRAGRDRTLRYWIRTDEDDDVILDILPRPLPWRLRTLLYPGYRCGQGQRVAFMQFGGEVRVSMPANSRVDAAEGDMITCGSQPLGALVHDNA